MSDQQQPQTLAQLVRAKYPGAYDDMTDQQLEMAVKQKYPGAYDDIPTTPDPVGDAAGKAEHLKGPMSLTDRALSLLPTIAGAVGGIAGARFGLPGRAVAGGAAGGAGELVRGGINMARGVPWAPENATELLKGAGKEALIQGGLEVVGAPVVGAAKSAGRAMVENAVRPPISLQREFPDVIDTIVEKRIPVGKGIIDRRPGSQQAAEQLKGLSLELRSLLSKANAAGVRYDPANVAEPVQALIRDIQQEPLFRGRERQVRAMLREFIDSHPGALTPEAVKALKQRAQALAASIYRAEEKGNVVPARQALEARFNKAIATGARKELTTAPKVGGPGQAVYDEIAEGIGKTEAETQKLIGATRAVSQAEMRRLPLWAEAASAGGGVVGGLLLGETEGLPENIKRGVLTYLAIRGVSSPRAISRVGLTLTKPQLLALYRQFPRLAEAVVKQARVGSQGQTGQTEPQ